MFSWFKKIPPRWVIALVIALQASMNVVSGRSGYVWIIDPEGVFLAHHDLTFVGRSSFKARRKRIPDSPMRS